MIIRNRTTKARRADKITGRGATPASQWREGNPEGVTERFCRPFRANVYATVYRGCTPACSLLPPLYRDSDKTGTIYDLKGHKKENLSKGLNIVRSKDGKTRKVIMK